MIVGLVTTLLNPEPKSEDSSTAFSGTSDYLRFFAVFAIAVAAFVAGFVTTGDTVKSVKAHRGRQLGCQCHHHTSGTGVGSHGLLYCSCRSRCLAVDPHSRRQFRACSGNICRPQLQIILSVTDVSH